jgi:predicted molibdopterin-dependent oxidoreductase YjgC
MSQWLHVQDGKIVKVTGVMGAEPNKGRLCVKGRFGYDFIYSRKEPLIKENGEFRKLLGRSRALWLPSSNRSSPKAVPMRWPV